MTNMDHAEAVARNLIESVVAGARMVFNQSQSRGEHDFDLHYPDGRVAAVEVTSSVDQALEETHDAITNANKGGSAIPTHLCKNSWYIVPIMGARINRLRAEADKYLAVIESAGIKKFRGLRDEHPSVEAIYRDLGVISGSVASWVKPGNILMALPGEGGAIGVGTVVEAAEREAFKDDNRKKLAATGKAERHLAIYVYVTNLPWIVLTDFEPEPTVPRLPPEITDIWVFSETPKEHQYVVWRAGTSLPWQKSILTLAI